MKNLSRRRIQISIPKLIFRVPVFWVLVLGFFLSAIQVHAGPEGRTRTFCLTYDYACGGHLQPQCTSGAICDAGHNSYIINKKINCPWPLADQTVTAGCYDHRPNCGDCSANGQVPCPPEAEPFCTSGCDAGLVSHPKTTICGTPGASGIPPGDIGATCGPGYSCKSGLACDETQFRCVGKVQAGQSCLNPFVPCDTGLACSWGVCSHVPGRPGETCDVAKTCGDGLFCQAGIPQRCKPLRKVGEGCSVFNPCDEGAFCDACVGEGCNSVLQCWPEQQGVWTEESCLSLRSPGLHKQIENDAVGLAHTFSVGNSGAAGVGESQEFGVMYGDYGRYGCFSTLCGGINIDLGIEAFVSFGFMASPDVINGPSFISFEEVQLANVLNYAAVQVFPRGAGELVPNNALVGTNAVLALGTPTNPFPLAGGTFVCDTVLQEFPVPDDQGGLTVIPAPGPGPGGNEVDQNKGTGAVQFNGTANNKIALSSASALSALAFNQQFSIALWISPAEENQSVTFLSKEGEYQLALRNGELSYTLANVSPGWVWVNSGFYPPIEKWTQVTFTYDSSVSDETNLRVYINGELKHELNGTGAIGDVHAAQNQFQLGGRELASEPPIFNGVLDDVRVWSRALTPVEVRANIGGFDSAGLLTNLVAGWKFNETIGMSLLSETTSDFDMRLNSVDTVTPPVRVEGNKAGFEGVLYFDGTENHVAVVEEDPLAVLIGSNTFTFEAWLMPNNVGAVAGANIISKGGEFAISRNAAGNLVYELATTTPGWSQVVTDIALPLNEWTHLAFVYDGAGGELIIYINGAPVYNIGASGALEDTDITDNSLRIGLGFDGYIDEVRVWTVARSAGDISANYATSLSSPLSSTEELALLGYWKFNENNLMLNFDSSGKHNVALYGSGNLWESPLPVNMLNEEDYPKTLLGDPCDTVPLPDEDSDGICDNIDNCPVTANADQLDSDNDGEGDACLETKTPPVVTQSGQAVSNRTVQAGANDVVMLRFTLDSNFASSSFDSLTLAASGSGNDMSAISSVKLWIDTNADGAIDLGDQLLGSGTYTSNNGSVKITMDSVYVLPFGQTAFLVTYDFN